MTLPVLSRVVLLAVLCCSTAQAEQTTTLVVDPSTSVLLRGGIGPSASQDRVSQHQHSSHHGNHDLHPDICFNELRTRPARWLKPDADFFPTVPEDETHPGKPDLSVFESPQLLKSLGSQLNATRDLWKGQWQLELAFLGTAWPKYMITVQGSVLPDDLDAAASMQVAYLRAVHAASGVLPSYVEAINEPFSNGANFSQVANLTAALTSQCSAAFGDALLVGGPATANTNFAQRGLEYLDDSMGALLTAVPNLPFISFHFFDSFSKTPGSLRTHQKAGGHGYALFDTLQTFSAAHTGKRIPIWVTEHGFASDDMTDRLGLLAHHQLASHIGQLLFFLEQSEMMIHSSSFLMDFSYEWAHNPSTSLVNVTTKTASVVAEYERLLLRLDNATRLSQRLSDDDGQRKVISGAFRLPTDEVVIVIVNLANEPMFTPVRVNLTITGIEGFANQTRFLKASVPNNIEDPNAVLTTSTLATTSLSSLQLAAQELIVLTLTPTTNTQVTAPEAELERYTFYCTEQMPRMISKSGPENKFVIQTDGAVCKKLQRAVLRVSYGRAIYKDITPLPTPSGSVSGIAITGWARFSDMGLPSNETGHSQWNAWEADLDVSKVDVGKDVVADLTIDRSTGGGWTSVALVAFCLV